MKYLATTDRKLSANRDVKITNLCVRLKATAEQCETVPQITVTSVGHTCLCCSVATETARNR